MISASGHNRKCRASLNSLVLEESHIELLPKQAYIAAFTQNHNSIGFAFQPQSGEHALGSDRKQYFEARANGLAFVPADCDIYSQSESGGEYLKVTLHETTAYSSSLAVSANTYAFNNHVDAGAIRAAHSLRKIMLAADTPDALQIESCVFSLLHSIHSVFSPNSNSEKNIRQLSPFHFRLVEDYIAANLGSPLTVSKLAGLCGLSTTYFARAFKTSSGQSPHEYILDRRINRARERIGSEQTSLTDIAITTGFSSHAHMTSTCTARLGVSPSAIRNSCKR